MSIILSSDRLTVQVAEPGVFPNTTTRFDRAGFVVQVTLDDRHQFCTREPDNLSHPCSGGYGICNEFRFNEPALEAPMGTRFPKIGVGLLTKDLEGRYVFHHRYPCEPFPITFAASKSEVVFETTPVECMGYAVRERKRLQVLGNQLVMDITIDNVGERPLSFGEYCHNFITIDRLPLSPEYYLSLPVVAQDGKSAQSGVALTGKGNGVGVLRYSNEASMFIMDASEITAPAPFTWRLTHAATSAAISETISVLPARMMIWAIDHIISPEIVCNFQITPGETASWTRCWTFED